MPHDKSTSLADAYKTLLDKQENEQAYQSYIEENSALVPRAFLLNHGIHMNVVLRKPTLARDYIPDFLYLSKSSIAWNCVLIEIEKPQSKYFKDNGNKFHSDFLAGLDQINRWRAWFENQSNKDSFFSSTLSPLMVPVGMALNTKAIKYVLVHGRRAEAADNPARRQLIKSHERDDFNIMSFDSLMEGLEYKNSLYVGRRTNEHIDVMSSDYCGEALFSLVASSSIRITQELRAEILAHKKTWHFYHEDKRKPMMEFTLPEIGVCKQPRQG